MRGAIATLILMLAAAVGICLGGVRLARRDVVLRTPADRVRLQEFSDAISTELARLEELYIQHLSRAADAMHERSHDSVRAAAERTIGISEVHFITENGALESVRIRLAERTPEFVVEGGKTPISLSNAVVFPRALLSSDLPRGWFGAPSADWRVFWQAGHDATVTALLVDMRKARNNAAAHVARWLDGAFLPMREAREFVQVRAKNAQIAGPAIPADSPLAVTIPLRNMLGSWEISAWDRSEPSVAYDPATVAASITAAGLLAALAVVLFRSHRRALRLAEERVSFVNRVSHELGTPLTNVLLNLSLADDAVESRPDRARSRLRLVTEEVQRLARLVGNVLTFSRSERGTLSLSAGACVPDDVVSSVLDQFGPSLKRRGIVVEWTPCAAAGVSIAADALAQITGNLVSNMEKYAASGGWLGVSTAFESDWLIVRVSDRGPGIPSAAKERIFEPFERVGAGTDEGSSGTGLGLSIARDLAERMGGSLELHDAESGAVFELRIPAPRIITALADSEAA